MDKNEIHFGLKIPKEIHDKVVKYCIKDGIKIKRFVANALIHELERKGQDAKTKRNAL